jgi:hypothetical protein
MLQCNNGVGTSGIWISYSFSVLLTVSGALLVKERSDYYFSTLQGDQKLVTVLSIFFFFLNQKLFSFFCQKYFLLIIKFIFH